MYFLLLKKNLNLCASFPLGLNQCAFSYVLHPSEKVLSQNEHLCGFFPSWIDCIWVINRPVIKGQITSKGLFGILGFFQKNERSNSFLVLLGKKKPNSYVRFLEESEDQPRIPKVLSKLSEVLKLQIEQLRGFFLSWTESVCLFNSLFSKNIWSQIMHFSGFFPSLIEAMWCFKLNLVEYTPLQNVWHGSKSVGWIKILTHPC